MYIYKNYYKKNQKKKENYQLYIYKELLVYSAQEMI